MSNGKDPVIPLANLTVTLPANLFVELILKTVRRFDRSSTMGDQPEWVEVDPAVADLVKRTDEREQRVHVEPTDTPEWFKVYPINIWIDHKARHDKLKMQEGQWREAINYRDELVESLYESISTNQCLNFNNSSRGLAMNMAVSIIFGRNVEMAWVCGVKIDLARLPEAVTNVEVLGANRADRYRKLYFREDER